MHTKISTTFPIKQASASNLLKRFCLNKITKHHKRCNLHYSESCEIAMKESQFIELMNDHMKIIRNEYGFN
jgi:hypothetical protein